VWILTDNTDKLRHSNTYFITSTSSLLSPYADFLADRPQAHE
jgi:hypothetical protein